MITLETLAKMPSGHWACQEAIDWFIREFPDGGELETVWNACENNEWKIWFTCNYLSKAKVNVLLLKLAGQAFRFAARQNPSLSEFSDAITRKNLRKAHAAADAAHAAAHAAAYAIAAAIAEQVAWCEEILLGR